MSNSVNGFITATPEGGPFEISWTNDLVWYYSLPEYQISALKYHLKNVVVFANKFSNPTAIPNIGIGHKIGFYQKIDENWNYQQDHETIYMNVLDCLFALGFDELKKVIANEPELSILDIDPFSNGSEQELETYLSGELVNAIPFDDMTHFLICRLELCAIAPFPIVGYTQINL